MPKCCFNFTDQYYKRISELQEVLSTPDFRGRQQAINTIPGMLDKIVPYPVDLVNAGPGTDIEINGLADPIRLTKE